MAEVINVKVDVSKLDKDRFFKGKKGIYCDLVLIPTPESQFGTWGIVQKSTKEERDSGSKMPFVGNADFSEGGQQQNRDGGATTSTYSDGNNQQNFSGSQASQRPMTSTISATAEDLQGDDIPF